jgi:hypothetical protein
MCFQWLASGRDESRVCLDYYERDAAIDVLLSCGPLLALQHWYWEANAPARVNAAI